MKIEKMNSQKTFPLEKIRIISCIILLVMTFASCVDYSDEATAISAKVQVTAPEEFTNGSNLEGKTVSLLNAAGNKFTAKTMQTAWHHSAISCPTSIHSLLHGN